MPVETPQWIQDLRRPYATPVALAYHAAIRWDELWALRGRDLAVLGDADAYGIWLPCSGGRILIRLPFGVGMCAAEHLRSGPDDPLLDGLDRAVMLRIMRSARGQEYGFADLRRDRLQAQFAAHGGLSAALLARDGGFDFTWPNGVRCYGPGALPPNIAGLVSWLDSLASRGSSTT